MAWFIGMQFCLVCGWWMVISNICILHCTIRYTSSDAKEQHIGMIMISKFLALVALMVLPSMCMAWCNLGRGRTSSPSHSPAHTHGGCIDNNILSTMTLLGPVVRYTIDNEVSRKTSLYASSTPSNAPCLDPAAIDMGASIPTATSSKHSLHIISLPPKNDTFALPGESLVRECWRWKDTALGDGRDYFVPRPRALKAFHSLFVGMEISLLSGIGTNTNNAGDDLNVPLEVVLKLPSHNDKVGKNPEEVRIPLNDHMSMRQSPSNNEFNSSSETFVVDECAALSNCARLDVILVLKRIQSQSGDERINNSTIMQNTISQAAMIAARYAVAYNLQQQIYSQRTKTTTLLERTGLTSWLDLPGAVNLEKKNDSPISNTLRQEQYTEIDRLSQRLTSLEGARSITTHLSLIAGGLAPRPNRPDREVIFRPYSSRDAHILLQLKRTVEVVSVLKNGKDNHDKGSSSSSSGSESSLDDKKTNGGRGRIKTLLDGALSAGKAARNEDVVPEIVQLKEYGSDGTPPVALANIIAEAAIERAVIPTVATCTARLSAMETDTIEQISQLRQSINDIVASLESTNNAKRIELQKRANKLLHEPTIQLREGLLSQDDIKEVIMGITTQLLAECD